MTERSLRLCCRSSRIGVSAVAWSDARGRQPATGRPAAFRVLGLVEFRRWPSARVVDPSRCPATFRRPRRGRCWSGLMVHASAIPALAGGLRWSAGRMGS